MKVAVTGATGFIGQYVIQELIKQNAKIVAISRSDTDIWKDHKSVTGICLDIENCDDKVFNLIERPDALIHLAWAGLPNYNATRHLSAVPKHLRFLMSCIDGGLKQLIVTGTCLEYGAQEGGLTENSPILASTAYGIAKDKLRTELEVLHRDKPFEFSWLRLFYLFGLGQSKTSLYSQLSMAVESGCAEFNMSPGDQTRDYIPVEEAARLIVEIALRKEGVGVINISSGTPISVELMVKKWLLLKKANIKLNLGVFPYPDYEARHFWGDRSKLNAILGEK
jgi:dTDP-6-deoxy-L-talose 4-dehydrogenase (NAD+)